VSRTTTSCAGAVFPKADGTLEHAAAESHLADAQNERILTGNTEILQHVAALEARILRMEQTILVAVGATAPTEGDG